MSIITFELSQKVDFNSQNLIKVKAHKEGYDLTNPNDDFFLDICLPYSYRSKDVTLEYRQKYFFFPTNKEKITFQFSSPKRNDTYSCFSQYFNINYIYKNMAFLFQFPLFIFEFAMLFIVIYITPTKCFTNTPSKQIDLIKKGKCFLNKYDDNRTDNNFSKFVGEGAVNDTAAQNINNTIYTDESGKNEEIEVKLDNLNKNNDEIEHRNSQDSNSQFKNNENKDDFIIENDNNIKEQKEENINIDTLKENSLDNNLNIEDVKNIQDNMNTVKNQISINKEKSIDNYTFGINMNIQPNFKNDDEKTSSKREKPEKKNEDTLKRLNKIYNSLNNDKQTELNKMINNKYNAYKPSKPPADKITYSKEEYFYFGYALASLMDNRNIFQIYLDLLNQCQIIFKFCFIPFNIYEDRKLQLLYYASKINLHLLFNLILTNNSVINHIYDNDNTFKDDIERSLLSCIFTYIIGFFISNLSNIKTTLIKRKNNMVHLRISDYRINNAVYKITTNLCMNYFINKLYILFLFLVLISIVTIYICFSFCIIYKYTQIYIFKCVLYSCIFSQIAPFIFCWIPAFLRKISLSKKKIKLYSLVRKLESLILP